MNRVRRLPAACASAVACALLVSACQRGPDDAKLLAETTAYVQKEDFKAAIVSAKSLLQRKPDNADARLLLGQALLEGGDPAAAAVELRKAQEFGAPEARVLPWLAKALLAQGDTRQVVAQFSMTRLDDAAASADLGTTLASAYAAQRQLAEAREALQAALKEWPQHAPARVLEARLAATDGDIPGALALVDKLLASDPKFVPAYVFKGDLLRADDPKAALAAYRGALSVKPDATVAHVAIVALLLEQKDMAAAREQFAKLKALDPNAYATRLFEAQLAFLDGDYAKTRELAGPLLKAAPNNPRVLQLAGAAELRLNSMVQAETYLAQAMQVVPTAVAPRRMLAQIYLRTGQPQRALEVLQPMVEGGGADAASLVLAGQAHLQAGDPARSESMFARAAKLDPNDTSARTALALNKLAKGQTADGFADLEAAAAGEAGASAHLTLIAARLRAGDNPGALKAIGDLERKQPDKPLAAALRGNVLARMKDAAGATASFEQALRIDPLYYPATAGLAALALAANKPAEAQARFEALLKADPKSYRALLSLADLKARNGAPQAEVDQAIADAVKLNPSEPTPRLMQVRWLSSLRDTKAALAAAQEAAAALPNNLEVLDALGQAQLAAGQAQQAISTWGKVAAQRPGLPEPELRLAEAHLANKDPAAARRSLERALKIKPGVPAALFGLTKLDIADKRFAQAADGARALQRAQPRLASGFLLEAETEIARQRPEAALAPLRTAVALPDGVNAAITLHRVLRQLGRADEAERLVAAWKKDHPQDTGFVYYQGDEALARQDFTAAEAFYRQVASIQPRHALALNNIAWLMTRQSKPGAVELAEQANKLLPHTPALMDTLAWALANENQTSRAIELQKQAVNQSPDDAGLKLTLAKIYIKAGDRTQARTELYELVRLGPKFAGQGEVAELLKTL